VGNKRGCKMSEEYVLSMSKRVKSWWDKKKGVA
jgi:hypothetical protein